MADLLHGSWGSLREMMPVWGYRGKRVAAFAAVADGGEEQKSVSIPVYYDGCMAIFWPFCIRIGKDTNGDPVELGLAMFMPLSPLPP
jgi:hypothetical protein